MKRLKRWLPGFIRWVWPLLALAGTCFAVFLVYRRHDFTQHENNLIAIGIGCGYFFAAGTMVLLTRQWTLRSLGQVATYLCDGVFYTMIGAHAEFTKQRLDALRAGFTVGVLALVIGVLWWGVRTHGGTRDRRPLFRRPPPASAPPPTDQVIGYQLAGTPVPPERSDA